MTAENTANKSRTVTASSRVRAPSAKVSDALDLAWRSEVVSAFGLLEPEFQIAMDAAHLRVDDGSGLLSYSDFVPPKGKVGRVSSRTRNRRSAAYEQMLKALLPLTETGLRGVLGAHYADWIDCRNADPGGVDLADLFSAWAQARLPKYMQESALSTYSLSNVDPSHRALEAVADPCNRIPFVQRNGTIVELPLYSITRDHSYAATRQPVLRPIAFDSASCSGTGPAFNLFGGKDAELTALGLSASQHRITVEGSVSAWGSAPTHPGAWCDEFELDRAWIAGDDPNVWDRAAHGSNWKTFFGENGSLAHRVARILTVRGLDLTVTSHRRYSSAEAGLVATRARCGVWPLLASDGPPVHHQSVRHNQDGTLSLDLSLRNDRLQIWGAYISDAPD